MARGSQHRKRRPQAHAQLTAAASAPRRPKHQSWEDQLFFARIRTHAKWVFVILAAVFALSFVVLGVGSGSSGISDLFQNLFSGSSASSGSLSKLQKLTVDHPKDAAAWQNYATALQQHQENDAAITALTQYTTLRPKDQNALLELAGLYRSRASAWYTIYANLSASGQALAPSSPLSPKAGTPLASGLASLADPLASAVQAQSSAATSTAYQRVVSYLDSRLTVYQKLAALTPKDAITQYSLGQAAQDAGNTAVAIKAYKTFLTLAPSDSQAASARSIIKQLEAQTAASGGAASTGKK